MTLADDLRQAAVDVAAARITQTLTGTGGCDPEQLARAAVDAAAPFLEDARRVDEVLAMREPADRRNERPKLTAAVLWREAGGDEQLYLELMEEHGWLTLTTCRVDGGTLPA
jgi:O-acetyl-ADP-ribose deacetylase (regulator of RNase III)